MLAFFGPFSYSTERGFLWCSHIFMSDGVSKKKKLLNQMEYIHETEHDDHAIKEQYQYGDSANVYKVIVAWKVREFH